TQTTVSSSCAAFANGALIHALNFDPMGPCGSHLGPVCLASQLAVAEEIGHVSGKELIVASVMACELAARLSMAIGGADPELTSQILPGQMLSYFAAAIGAARICRLDSKKMQDALGISLMQAAGSRQLVRMGDPPAKAIYGAFPNQAAVIATGLSEM